MKRLVDDVRALDSQWHTTVKALGLALPDPCDLCAAVAAEEARATATCRDCPAPLALHPFGCEPATETLPGGSTRDIRRPKYRPEPEARQMATDRRHGLRTDLCGLCGGLGWLRDGTLSVSQPNFGRAVRCSCNLSPDLWYLTAPKDPEAVLALEPETRHAESRIPAHSPPPFWRTKRLGAGAFDRTDDNSKALDAAWDFEADPGDRFLVIGGGTGRGKTHLAAGIYNALRGRGVDVEVWPWAELRQTVMAGFGGGDAALNLEIARKRCRTAPVLIVDDLSVRGEESPSLIAEWEAIVDARYSAGLPLAITTNEPAADLKKWSERAFSRLYEKPRAVWVAIKGQDRRTTPTTENE